MDNLKLYLKSIQKYPTYSAKDSVEIVQNIREYKKRLVNGNLKLVVKIAKEHARLWQNFDVMDFIQEGNMALLRCADKYSPERGPFTTYLGFSVRTAIMAFIKNNTGTLRLYKTDSQRTIFNNLAKVRSKYLNNISLDTIAEEFGVAISDLELILGTFNPADLSSITVDSPEDATIRKEDHDAIFDKIEQFRQTLSPRQLKIFDETMYKGNRYIASVARDLKLSREIVRRNKNDVIELAREFFSLDDLKRIQVGDIDG